MILSEGFSACRENITDLEKNMSDLEFCEKVHLHEAAKETFGGVRFEAAMKNEAMAKLYCSAVEQLIDDPLTRNRNMTFCFSEKLCEVLGAPGTLEGFCRLFSGETSAGGKRISCMRGGFSDSAYDVFSEALGTASVLYADSFSDVCENLYHSRCDYALLPFADSQSGVLSAFADLIEKYELFVCGITGIEQDGDGAFTSFALLSKNIEVPAGSGDVQLIIETIGEKTPVGFISSAAEYFGGYLTQTQSFRTADGRYKTRCTAALPNGNPAPFLASVLLNVPGTELRGLYKEI